MKRTQVAQSSVHGRGLFAGEDIIAGDEIGEFHLLILSGPESEALKATRLHHYVFWVDDQPGGQMRTAIAFGAISMCNHNPDENARFDVLADEQIIRLTACKDIPEGEEILIDYEDFATEVI